MASKQLDSANIERKDKKMNFIVIELQTTETTSALNYVFADRLQAEQKYHEILSYAAVSTVPIHGAVMLTSEGVMINSEYYDHREVE